MKKISNKISRFLPLALLAIVMGACTENSWNDHLDGFEPGQDLSDVQTVSYTLTNADYGRFANNRFNKALAIQDSINGVPGAIKALKAVASQHYITSETPAETYMPNLLLDSLFAYYTLSDGSAINLTYNEVGEIPATIKGVNASKNYTVSENDYDEVYGGEGDYADAFNPGAMPDRFLPRLLEVNVKDVVAGDYVFVQYNWSDVMPQITSGKVTLPKETRLAVWTYNGSWSEASDVLVVQPSDYSKMGLNYSNFSGSQPEQYIPTLLAQTYPYAAAEKQVYVAYKYYASGETSNVCSLWEFDGTKWYDAIATNGVQAVTNQFVRREGKWQLDPSIDLVLPKGKNQPVSTKFFQACVDWVLENVPDGSKYVTSYGNNDYYTGASAYQGNIDLRASSARLQYAAAYEGMTDEEVVALMQKRFEDEVCPAVLKEFYPDIAPVGSFNPTVTIHFFTYNGASTEPAVIVYTVTGKATFELKGVNWDGETIEEGE